MTRPPVILASQSPRRRQILEALGLRFTVKISAAEERSGAARDADAVARDNARAKAAAVAGNERSSVVIGCDTIVVAGEILGKPKDREDARRMLGLLSGTSHEVVSGLALLWQGKEALSATRSKIRFRKLTAGEIEAYLATPEPYDKAGSYAVQGLASLFVESIEGSYTNVMGLPLERLLLDLEGLTGTKSFQWVL